MVNIGAGELFILAVIGFFVCVLPVLAVLGVVVLRGRRVRER